MAAVVVAERDPTTAAADNRAAITRPAATVVSAPRSTTPPAVHVHGALRRPRSTAMTSDGASGSGGRSSTIGASTIYDVSSAEPRDSYDVRSAAGHDVRSAINSYQSASVGLG